MYEYSFVGFQRFSNNYLYIKNGYVKIKKIQFIL